MKVTVRKIRADGNVRWQVDWAIKATDGTRRRFREKFDSQRLAEGRREEVLEQARRGGEAWLSMPPARRIALMFLFDQMQAEGVTPEKVWEDWKSGKGRARTADRPIGELIDQLLKVKEAAKRRPEYLSGLKSYLKAFARGREAKAISAFTVQDIERWFSDRAESPASMASNLGRLSSLFGWAHRQGLVAENPVDGVEKPTVDVNEVVILTLEQSVKALEWAKERDSDFLAWLTLGLLAGMRPEEAGRLKWEDINLEDGVARIGGAATKVRERRIVHLTPATVGWMRIARDAGAKLPMGRETRRRRLRELREVIGFSEWPQDILRKTAASNLFAAWQDSARVAAELGTSERMLFRHYREVVRRSDAERWLAETAARAENHARSM